jgi:hypothetical protein
MCAQLQYCLISLPRRKLPPRFVPEGARCRICAHGIHASVALNSCFFDPELHHFRYISLLPQASHHHYDLFVLF